LFSVILISTFFILSSRKASIIPSKFQFAGESVYSFVRENLAKEVIGHDFLRFVPYLFSLFTFILVNNIFGIIPFIQMPATARMAIPMFLAVLVWVVFNVQGIKHQGFFGYFKSVLFPPGVPKALYILVTPIEFISTLIVRPFSLAVRLFANMLAGHLLLVIFALLSEAMFQARDKILIPIGVLPFFMLVFLTGFEVLVAFLQAYIFTILAAVYIAGAVHPEH
ncbi:MAG: hypothetical protein RJA50_207, partial [Actinomycetota bacterium]